MLHLVLIFAEIYSFTNKFVLVVRKFFRLRNHIFKLMETLAYLHLIEDFQNPKTQVLNSNLSQATSKAAIGLIGTACTASVLAVPTAAFACSYHDSHYYTPQNYSSQPDSYESCGCDDSQQSYSPDYSHGYSHNYSYYSPIEPSYDGHPYHGTGYVHYTGEQGPFVATLQSVLADLGYYNGPIDGVYGPGTSDAITWYQIENGLVVDGIAGGQTLDSLGLAGYGA